MDADEAAMVGRSSIAPCVTCGLCGGILRDATTVSECLHSCELLRQLPPPSSPFLALEFLMREMGMRFQSDLAPPPTLKSKIQL
ncbi:median body protein-like [Panicum miliaceum]|uniref:Median body protein-like n=1 Tax=Panicum miliaceum TaxID=4540 RepID=A0A3L6QSY3_PANMI|nr:median body protein-like [Panicum miliaceum]